MTRSHPLGPRPRPARPPAAPPRAARAILPLAAVLLGLSACGGGDAEPAGDGLQVDRTTRGDTTVVRITGGPADSLVATEAWRVGSGDGTEETAFSAIYSLARSPADGALYAYDGQAGAIFRIDADGTPRGQVGRQGGGPGEYGQVNGLAGLSDGALAVWDGSGSRIVTFEADGTPRSTVTAPVTGFITFNGMVSDTADRLWLVATERIDRDSVIQRHVRMRADGTVLDSVVRPGGGAEPQTVRVERTNGSSRMSTVFNVPYSPASGTAVEVSGNYVAWPGDAYVVVADRAAGPLRIERDATPVAVGEDERDAVGARLTRQARRFDPDYRPTFTIADEKPPLSDVLPGVDGSLWVRVPVASVQLPPAEGDTTNTPRYSTPQAWDVYAADGAPIGSLVLPLRTRVLVVSRDMAWGIVPDDDDVPTIVAWRIAPAGDVSGD